MVALNPDFYRTPKRTLITGRIWKDMIMLFERWLLEVEHWCLGVMIVLFEFGILYLEKLSMN